MPHNGARVGDDVRAPHLSFAEEIVEYSCGPHSCVFDDCYTLLVIFDTMLKMFKMLNMLKLLKLLKMLKMLKIITMLETLKNVKCSKCLNC